MEFYFGFYVGALIPTFIISRLFLKISNKFFKRDSYILANIGSLIVSGVVFSFGNDFGFGYFVNFIVSVIYYALPQASWLVFDFLKRKK